MILALRTDKPEAELHLYKDEALIDSLSWEAHRELSDTLLVKIDDLLARNNQEKPDLRAIIVFQGPGSFTGLRIGITVANTFAYSLNIPVIAVKGDDWQNQGMGQIVNQSFSGSALPHYGSEARITKPRK